MRLSKQLLFAPLAALLVGICSTFAYGETNNAATNAPDIEALMQKANKGDVKAECELGNCYAHRDGVPLDYTNAVNWFRKASEQGDAKSQNELGLCYYYGSGVPKDYAEAVKWYREAAEQGNADGQFELGLCYYRGDGITQDDTEASKWFRKAAAQGNGHAPDFLLRMSAVNQTVNRVTPWLLAILLGLTFLAICFMGVFDIRKLVYGFAIFLAVLWTFLLCFPLEKFTYDPYGEGKLLYLTFLDTILFIIGIRVLVRAVHRAVPFMVAAAILAVPIFHVLGYAVTQLNYPVEILIILMRPFGPIFIFCPQVVLLIIVFLKWNASGAKVALQ